jgi:hypothetical protein
MGVRMTHSISGGEYIAQREQVPHLEEAGWEQVPGQDIKGEEWPAELRRYGGQPEVRLRHPVTGGEYASPESAVPYHQGRGWVRADEQAEQAATEGLETKTVPELRELAKAQGISPIPTTKPELLAALQGEQPAEQPAEPAQPSEEG